MKRLISLAMAALVAFALVTTSWAATPARASRALDLFDLGTPSFTTFSVRDGLPDPLTVTLTTDRQGFVWAGTPHGLAWYDGQRWLPLNKPALSGYIN